MISLSQRCAKHPFAGQNIQQSLSHTTTEAAPTPCQTAEHLRMCNLTKSFLNMILFSEHCAKHPFARQNKQQTSSTQQPKQLYHRARQQNIWRYATSQNHFLTLFCSVNIVQSTHLLVKINNNHHQHSDQSSFTTVPDSRTFEDVQPHKIIS